MGKYQNKKAKLSGPKEKIFTFSPEEAKNTRVAATTEEVNNAKSSPELDNQTVILNSNSSINWANDTEKELQNRVTEETTLLEHTNPWVDSEETTNTSYLENNNNTKEHVSSENNNYTRDEYQATNSGSEAMDPEPQPHDQADEAKNKTSNSGKSLQWSNLFPKLKGGKAVFSKASPRQRIHTKNENALILDIRSLINISTNDIVAALAAKLGSNLLAAKAHITKGKRFSLEIILKDKEKVQQYASEGISLFKQTLFGYIPVNIRRSFLTVKLRGTPMGDANTIGDFILEAFKDIGQVVSIKPLFFEDTTVCSDQWLVTFETTEDTELATRLPRSTHIDDHKVSIDWKEAPKVCFFCEKEGHIKKDCEELKASIKVRQELKEARAQLRQMTTQKLSSTDLKISENNPYTKPGIKKMEIETNSISSRSSTPVPEIPNKTSNNTETLVDKMIIESTIKNTTDIPNESTPKAISPNNNSTTESEDQDPNDPPFTTVVSKKQKLKNKKKGLGDSYHPYKGSEGSQKSGPRTEH